VSYTGVAALYALSAAYVLFFRPRGGGRVAETTELARS
jgi:hypothetical protein